MINLIDKESLLNIRTNNFTFRKPQFNQLELKVINEMLTDTLTNQFLSDLDIWIGMAMGTFNSQGRTTTITYNENIPIGIMSIYVIDDEEFVLSQGITPSKRGKGYSRRIKQEIMTYLFTRFPKLNCITSYIDFNNINSLRAIEKMNIDEQTFMNTPSGKAYLRIRNYNPWRKIKNEDKERRVNIL